MSGHLFISIGPVQGFIAAARRTRDLWGGSYLLSFLTAHAMKGAEDARGRIVYPKVDKNPLYTFVKNGSREKEPPRYGGLPNHFVVRLNGNDARCVAGKSKEALDAAWSSICGEVWEKYLKNVCSEGNGTKDIWERQVKDYWEFMWVAAEGDRSSLGELMERRKAWRTHFQPDEPGDKCTVMSEFQELSGYVRAKERENQDEFWNKLREEGNLTTLDIREGERLCALALVKRLFPKVAKEAIGWDLDVESWPSTVYVAAVPWISKVVTGANTKAEAEAYAGCVKNKAPGWALSESRASAFPDLGEGLFGQLEANYFHRHGINNPERCPLREGVENETAIRGELSQKLEGIYNTEVNGERIGAPPVYFALLVADGDRMGEHVARDEEGAIPEALESFSGEVPQIVSEHKGVTVYAGGDDLLAMLPVEGALQCAGKVRSCFKSKLSEKKIDATMSVAVVFAQTHAPLGSVIREGRRILDRIAKEENGRDSIGVSVYKRAGVNCQWVSTWEREDHVGGSGRKVGAVDLLYELTDELKAGPRAGGLSSSLTHRAVQNLMRLCDWKEWRPGSWGRLPTGFDPLPFLKAEALSSLKSAGPEGRGERDLQSMAEELAKDMANLIYRSRNKAGSCGHGEEEVGLDALLLAMFLAGGGVEEEHL